MRSLVAILLVLGLVSPVAANVPMPHIYAAPPIPKPRPAGLSFDAPRLCRLIEQAAKDYNLPPPFLARLIWQESRFDIRAVSPAGAQGVAQFMPATARIRGLKDPWDPRQAIPASASFLSDLRDRFNSLGLAAAGYNGGPDRVQWWLDRKIRSLPSETQNYVQIVTGHMVEAFRDRSKRLEVTPLEKDKTFQEACARLPVMRTRSPIAASAPWGVQIAAGISRRAALSNFRKARARYRSVVGGRGAIVVRSRKVGGRRLFSARVGASSRAAARRLCGRIKRIGGNCVVRRN